MTLSNNEVLLLIKTYYNDGRIGRNIECEDMVYTRKTRFCVPGYLDMIQVPSTRNQYRGFEVFEIDNVEDQNIIRLVESKGDTTAETTSECCGNCGAEVELRNEMIAQTCPNCQDRILPCSYCSDIKGSLRNCALCPLGG
jgi:DNA-directed RNA polymerase subunit RPC12/RpoP